MKVINITQGHPKYGQEINVTKDTYTEVIEQSLKAWFNNEEFLDHDGALVSHDDGYELEFITQAGGRYRVRVVK